MTQPAAHLDDEVLSALVDDQLAEEARSRADVHLATCSVCQARLDDFSGVAALLRSLPEVDPPRDFVLGPRIVADPPNVIPLRRWYTGARLAAAALAAVFVGLSAGALYVDSQPVPAPPVQVAQPRAAAAPTAQTSLARPAAPALAPRVLASPQPDDQVAAATSVSPLPTPVPTAQPRAVAPRAAISVDSSSSDPGAPLRFAAALVAVLTVVTLVMTFVLRRRLQRASFQ